MQNYTFKLYDNKLPHPSEIKKNNIYVIFKYCNISELSYTDEDFSDYIFLLPEWVEFFDLSYNSLYALYEGRSHDYKLPSNLKVLDFSYNKLTNIPDNLPENMVAMNISNNSIKYVPKLPETMKFINCSHNTIKWFDQEMPNLMKLDLSYNHIYYFRFDRLPSHLKHINLKANQLEVINGEFPENLEYLNISDNRLKEIPELPNNLKHLDVSENKLEKLPDFKESLVSIICNNNNIEKLHESLVNCKNLEKLNYENNENIEISFELLDFIENRFHEISSKSKKIETKDDIKKIYSSNVDEMKNIYKDSQNAHNSSIRNGIIESISSMLNDTKPEVDFEKSVELMKEHFKKEDTCDILLKSNISKIKIGDELYGMDTLFPYLFERIKKLEFNEDLVKVLEEEIHASKNRCFSGRLEAYMSSFAGFFDDIKYEVSLQDQIIAKIELIKKNLQKERIPNDSLYYHICMRYYLDEYLTEINVESETKSIWLEAFDDTIDESIAEIEKDHGDLKIDQLIGKMRFKKLIKEYFIKFLSEKNNKLNNSVP